MRNSLKLGFVLALSATAVFAGCSSGSDNTDGSAGTSAGGSTAGHAGMGAAGTNIIVAGSSAAGSSAAGSSAAGSSAAGSSAAGSSAAGSNTGGSSTGGASAAGSSTGGASSAGAAGHAGNAAAGTGGAAGGAGGTSGNAGNAGSAGSAGSGAGAGGGSGSGGSAGGPVDCASESVGLGGSSGAGTGGAAGAGGTGLTVSTAVILIDNVVVKKAAATLIQWQFPTADTIVDNSATDAPTAVKWARSGYGYTVSGNAGASDVFLDCAGNPDAGVLKNIVPFTAANQQYEIRVPVAQTDYSSAVITATVKLVGGGTSSTSCPVKAWIYAVNNVGGTNTDPNPIPLQVGKWSNATLTVPATGFDKVGIVGLRLTTFACQ